MIIKCKMCGGDINFNQGETSGQCEYCGSTSTIPKVDDEQRLNRYNRANHYRRQGEFDKAIAAYERILEEDDTDAEAHWGAALSRYGIEYVEDPASKQRIPTCHRVQLESILADADYQAALKYAPDTLSRNLYEEQAKAISEIQKKILAISANEKPYDVFICYKESDENGQRTRDSALAQEVYYGLTEQGFKVFFSRITLEDKLGQEYEPYIFAALHSARVMVVIGTKPEYFNAVWVRNEWSRYLHLMKDDRKRLLIPCYRDMDPYDLPEELSNLQSQDMSRIGFMQDLLRGIRKVLEAEKEKLTQTPVQAAPVVQRVVQEGSSHIDALLDRAFLSLEDGEFDKADQFCEQALNLDARNSRAYLGKLMAERKARTTDQLAGQTIPLESSNNYQKSIRFASAEQKKQLEGWNRTILERNERNRKAKIRDEAVARLEHATTVAQCEGIRHDLEIIREFDGVKAVQDACDRKAVLIQDKKYKEALENEKDGAWEKAISKYLQMKNYRDCASRIQQCEEALAESERLRKEKEEQERLIAERKAKEAARKKKKLIMISSASLAVIIAVILLVTMVIIPKGHYDRGISLRAGELWDLAVEAFQKAGSYSDAADQILETRYQEGEAKRTAGQWDQAVEAFQQAGSYSDAADQILKTRFQEGEAKRTAGQWDQAVEAFRQAGSYSDAADQILKTRYQEGEAKRTAGQWDQAVAAFMQAGNYSDAADQILKTRYQEGEVKRTTGLWDQAVEAFQQAGNYSDATDQILKTRYQEGEVKRAAGLWDQAVEAFQQVGNYSDAADQILKTRYQEGEAKRTAGLWDQAVEAFQQAGNYSDAAIQILETRYQEANNYYNKEDYISAYKLLLTLSDYKDVENRLACDDNLLAAAREVRIKPFRTVGASVKFGHYEQDNNAGNGQEEIEWIVLDHQDGKSLLLSKYALDSKPYNTEYRDITWENCTLRNWLNKDFLNGAFTAEEESAILNTAVDNSSSQGYSVFSTKGGNNTEDRIFLLSYHEAFDLYFSGYRERMCTPTDYAIAQGAYISSNKVDGRATGWWWLRSPGYFQHYAVFVNYDGSHHNASANRGDVCVRPAFWIDLESDIF